MSVVTLQGDCRDVLATMEPDSVDCVVSSPPYWGLRDYGVDGQLGQEADPFSYIAAIADVFDRVWPLLKADGNLFLNLGDTYAARPRGDRKPGGGKLEGGGQGSERARWRAARNRPVPAGWRASGFKEKELIGIPWRVAFALQERGWYLRNDIVWAKANGMPDSAQDRAGRAHEYVFHLTKSAKHYYGYDDVKLPPVPDSVARLQRAMRARLDGDPDAGPHVGSFVVSGGGYSPPGQAPHTGARPAKPGKLIAPDKQCGHSRRHAGFNERWDKMSRYEQQEKGAALRSVWWIAPARFAGPHYAVMPDELAAACVLSGCRPAGTVLDPFGGVGTTALVADRLQRDAVMIELSAENIAMAKQRLHGDGALFADVRAEGDP